MENRFTVAITVWSGLGYLVSNDAVKILTKKSCRNEWHRSSWGTSPIKAEFELASFRMDHHCEGPGALYPGKGSTLLCLLGHEFSCCPRRGSGRY